MCKYEEINVIMFFMCVYVYVNIQVRKTIPPKICAFYIFSMLSNGLTFST
jgi:uncharacterized membrane protein